MSTDRKRKKAPSGQGNIRKRVDKNGRVYFVAEIMLGYRADGKRDRRTVTGRTEQEVVRKLAALKTEYDQGTLVEPTRLTVAEYLVGADGNGGWLETHRRFGGRKGQGLRPNTYRGYRSIIEKHILPVIGGIKLQSLTPTHLEKLYTSILDKGLSMRQAHHAHQVIRTALQAAVDKEMIRRNPADKVPHKPRVTYRAEDRPRLAWEDVPKVLAKVEGTVYYLPFLLAMACGLRRGEILGLRWKNVDLEEGVIRVREQMQRDYDGKLSLQPVKTEASVRDVPIPQDVVDVLEVEAMTSGADPEDFVCRNTRGKHFQLGDLDHKWKTVREELGLPDKMTFHDLRGSWATWMAAKKVDPKATAALLGHSDVRVTWALYQSVTKEMKREAALAIEGITKAAHQEEKQAVGES